MTDRAANNTNRTDSQPLVVLTCGAVGAGGPAGARVFDITPSAPDVDGVLEALAASGLTHADTRCRVLVVCEGDATTAVLVASAVWGFAGGPVDVVVNGHHVAVAQLAALGRALSDSGRPDELLLAAQYGQHRDDLRSVVGDVYAQDDVAALRHAKRLRLALSEAPETALVEFAVLSGIRRKDGKDRFPQIVSGDEAAPLGGDNIEVGVCLDRVRRSANELRRGTRTSDRSYIAEAVELTARQERLRAAAAIDIESLLERLGAERDTSAAEPDTDVTIWRCPRPERHSNGDARPSMRSSGGLAQCFKCDPGPVDALRLTIDVFAVTGDEAADLLEDDDSFDVALRARQT